MLKTQVARDNVAKAGLEKVVKVVEGPAADTLAKMQPGDQPFDFVFIDADKENNLTYLLEAKRLTRKGAVIVRATLCATKLLIFTDIFRSSTMSSSKGTSPTSATRMLTTRASARCSPTSRLTPRCLPPRSQRLGSGRGMGSPTF